LGAGGLAERPKGAKRKYEAEGDFWGPEKKRVGGWKRTV